MFLPQQFGNLRYCADYIFSSFAAMALLTDVPDDQVWTAVFGALAVGFLWWVFRAVTCREDSNDGSDSLDRDLLEAALEKTSATVGEALLKTVEGQVTPSLKQSLEKCLGSLGKQGQTTLAFLRETLPEVKSLVEVEA